MKTPNYTKSFVKKAIRKYGKKLKLLVEPNNNVVMNPRQRRVTKGGRSMYSVNLTRPLTADDTSCFQHYADVKKKGSVKAIVDEMFAYDQRVGLTITALLVGDKLLQREPYTVKAKTKKTGRK